MNDHFIHPHVAVEVVDYLPDFHNDFPAGPFENTTGSTCGSTIVYWRVP